MKTVLKIILALGILVGAIFTVTKGSVTNCYWRPVLNDNFDTNSINSSIWSTQYHSGNGGEKQYYGPDAFTFGQSTLNITAQPTPANGYQYTSGIIQSRDKFVQQYGFFELRAKMPKGQGFWPAFWLLPNKPDFPVEIDVFELHGDDTHTIFMSLHWKGQDGSHQHKTVSYTSPADLSAGYHTYSLEWTPDKLTWYLDGTAVYSTTEHIPYEPMFILTNLAVGGTWPGNPNSSTPWPGVLSIDYMRASALTCSPNFIHWLFLPFLRH